MSSIDEKLRSCGSLQSGNDALLKVKGEPTTTSKADKKALLEKSKKDGLPLHFLLDMYHRLTPVVGKLY